MALISTMTKVSIRCSRTSEIVTYRKCIDLLTNIVLKIEPYSENAEKYFWPLSNTTQQYYICIHCCTKQHLLGIRLKHPGKERLWFGCLKERENIDNKASLACLYVPFALDNPGRVVLILWSCSYRALQPDAHYVLQCTVKEHRMKKKNKENVYLSNLLSNLTESLTT